jgi:hypothetical protein
MKFEDILPLLREGKKAYLPLYDNNGEYWQAGYIGITGSDHKTLTINHLNKEGKAFTGMNDWGVPRWMIMSDAWEIK